MVKNPNDCAVRATPAARNFGWSALGVPPRSLVPRCGKSEPTEFSLTLKCASPKASDAPVNAA